jgi:uncharacterized membrane protein
MTHTDVARPSAAWQRSTPGETRWTVTTVVVVTLGLQLLLPRELVLWPGWLLPALSGLLVLVLMAMNPGRLDRRNSAERLVSLALVAAISVVNGASAVELVTGIVTGAIRSSPVSVLTSAAIVYWTNIVVFSLWYWEFDRGGPALRANGDSQYADFMFPQMDEPRLAPPEWEPRYFDYLYLSFTNATAFSPTDVMPLKVWAKLTMMAQAAISLVIALLVVAWSVNALKG